MRQRRITFEEYAGTFSAFLRELAPETRKYEAWKIVQVCVFVCVRARARACPRRAPARCARIIDVFVRVRARRPGAQSEWANDAKSKSDMTYDKFYAALFDVLGAGRPTPRARSHGTRLRALARARKDHKDGAHAAADTWCDSLDVADYIELSRRLYQVALRLPPVNYSQEHELTMRRYSRPDWAPVRVLKAAGGPADAVDRSGPSGRDAGDGRGLMDWPHQLA